MEGIAGQAVELLDTYVGAGVVAGLMIMGVVMLGSLIWLRRPGGYSLRLYAMNPPLAHEIGIEEVHLRRLGTVHVGLCAGAAGCSLAITGGSTPELGMKVFLYGAGAALLFESRELLAPLPAGLMLGAMHVGLQLVLAPAWTESIMFALIVAVLLWRGTSREVGGVR